MSEGTTPKTPPALPKPESSKKFNWHGVGLHTSLTLIMLIGFGILLPWIFPGILQSPINLDPIEKKVKDFEQTLASYAPSTQGDLDQLRNSLARLEQKLEEQSNLIVSSSTKSANLVPLSILLRLEQAVLLGYSYEPIWTEAKTLFSIQPQDFPILEQHQHEGFTLIPLEPENNSNKSQSISNEEIPLFSHPWALPLTDLIKVRKYKSEAPKEEIPITITILIKYHKFEEALEQLQKSPSPQSDRLRQQLQNYLAARKELQLLWKRWQDENAPSEHSKEKSS